jgi:ABC-2 type transport system ATP-binding protein
MHKGGVILIQITNVSKKLGKFAIRDLNLTIPDGYICGLVGRNGAGKTSLLHLLLGLYLPDSGSVQFEVSEPRTYPGDEKIIHDMIGTVLAEDLLDAHLTARENGTVYGGYFSGYDAEQYAKWLRKFHVEESSRFGRLSKGEKLKCQFAFALSCNPKYLILDEPAANFDPEFRKKFWEVLRAFVADGERSVLLASHLTEDLDREADYLIYLDDGKAVFGGDMESFREGFRILSGEAYRLKYVGGEKLLYLEEREFGGAKALVRYSRSLVYGDDITATRPTIEEFMYFYSKYAESASGKSTGRHRAV